jgi:hypothetical protein
MVRAHYGTEAVKTLHLRLKLQFSEQPPQARAGPPWIEFDETKQAPLLSGAYSRSTSSCS